jgi:hypothetical protein
MFPSSTNRSLASPALAAALAVACAARAPAQDCDPHMALRFDGVDDFVDVADPQGLPLEKFTVGAWIRASSFGGARRGIVTRGEDPTTDHLPWGLELDADGSLFVEIEDALDNNLFYDSVAFVADGLWHHVAASRDGAGTLTLFIDGEIDSVHAGTIPPLDGAGAARVGNLALQNPPSEYGHFDGFIDEVFVYGEALHPDAVKKIWQAGVDPAYGALEAWLKLDEYDGDRCEDMPVNDHWGVLGADPLPDASNPTRVVSQAPICDKTKKLWFNLEPPVRSPGQEVQALAWGGMPGGLVALVISSIDGAPVFVIALVDVFDANGEYLLQDDLPDDAPTGITIGVTAWGQTLPAGKVKPSEEELLVLK